MKRTLPLLVCALCVLAVAFVSGCTGGSQPIVVTLTPSGAQAIDNGQSVSITVTVAHDQGAKGVTWSLAQCGYAQQYHNDFSNLQCPGRATHRCGHGPPDGDFGSR